MTLEQKLKDVSAWACCDWPARAIRAEHMLREFVLDLEERIPGVLAEFQANGTEGLAQFVVAWAWEDVERQIEEEKDAD